MTTDLTKKLMCICLWGDIELWVEEERVTMLKQMLENKSAHTFINIDGQLINTSQITGIFTAETMSERTRRKNGQWQCDYRKWYEKGDEGRQEHYWCKKDAEKTMEHISQLLKIKSIPKPLTDYRIVQRFNCGHIQTTDHPNPATIYNWNIHERDQIVQEQPEDGMCLHLCELIEVWQERRGLMRFYIIKGDSLPVTHGASVLKMKKKKYDIYNYFLDLYRNLY